jgi:hypothetical protein
MSLRKRGLGPFVIRGIAEMRHKKKSCNQDRYHLEPLKSPSLQQYA